MYHIRYEKAAVVALKKMPKNISKRIVSNIEAYAKNPDEGRNVIALRGVDAYRMRVGNWRVIFEKHDDVLLILILDVGARGGIYQ